MTFFTRMSVQKHEAEVKKEEKKEAPNPAFAAALKNEQPKAEQKPAEKK